MFRTVVKSESEHPTRYRSKQPDSLKKSLNFVSRWVKRNFTNCVKQSIWWILTWLGLLVNSAYVIHLVISFFVKNMVVLSASFHGCCSPLSSPGAHVHVFSILKYSNLPPVVSPTANDSMFAQFTILPRSTSSLSFFYVHLCFNNSNNSDDKYKNKWQNSAVCLSVMKI